MIFNDDIGAFMTDFATTLQLSTGVSFPAILEQESSDAVIEQARVVLTKIYYVADPAIKKYLKRNMLVTDIDLNVQWKIIDWELFFMEQTLLIYVSGDLTIE